MSELIMEEDFLEDDLEEEQTSFLVDNDQKAEWCLQKIREAEAEKQKWNDYYTKQMQAVADREDRRIQYFEYHLNQYFRTVPHKETKTQQSYHLPSGKLVLKNPTIVYEHDDEKLLPWLKNNRPAFVKVKESVDWSGLKKDLLSDSSIDPAYRGLVTDDGEIIPGITRKDKPAEFKVEVK